MLINIQDLSALIEFGVVFVEIELETYSVDRNESHITVDKYPKHINMNKYPRRIQLIFMLIYLDIYSCW